MRRRKGIMILLLTAVALCGAGCRRNDINRREIDTIDFVRMAAIDAEESNQMKVTLETIEAAEGEETQGKSRLLSAAADSFAEAFLQMQEEQDKLLNLAHSDFFLVGEEAAKRGIAPYLDFVFRSNQIQLTAEVFVVKGMSAAELLQQCGETGAPVSKKLENLADKVRELSVVKRTSVIDVMGMTDDPYNAMKIPYLEAVRKADGQTELKIGGYALFRDNVLTTFAGEETSRGITFFDGEVYGGVIPVRTADEAVVTRISDAKTKTKISTEQNTLRVRVQVELHTVPEEIHAAKNLFLPEEYDALLRAQNQYVTRLLRQAAEAAAESETDALSLAKTFSMQHPILWEERKENWQQWVREAQFEIAVSTQTERSYDYEEANRTEENA